mgnify:CR=1 FL=1
MERQFLRTKQAAEYLGYSASTLYRKAASGEIKGIYNKNNRLIGFKFQIISRWIDNNIGKKCLD